MFKDKFIPPAEEAPYWSESSFDGVKIAGVISARAVIYYQAMSEAFRSGKSPTKIRMSETSFGYQAAARYHENYEIEGRKFTDVDVVILKLSWSQYCGSLCAMGFSKRKIVIFDKNNEPVAMFMDLYGGAWVS